MSKQFVKMIQDAKAFSNSKKTRQQGRSYTSQYKSGRLTTTEWKYKLDWGNYPVHITTEECEQLMTQQDFKCADTGISIQPHEAKLVLLEDPGSFVIGNVKIVKK
jgi:hypothetical protein